MTSFVDRAVLHAQAGNGGNGCSSIYREKFKPLGGPDGGNGGRGGDVIITADANVSSLLDITYHPHRRGSNGAPGQGGHKNGGNGKDSHIPVPVGTVVYGADGSILADLTHAGDTFVAARGGRGGLGNAALSSRRRVAPAFALKGEPGDEVELVLELKMLADVGLVGFPSAGKSSLISVISAAKPKIADYPFTTLVPNLGVVTAGQTVFTVADVPGLIPGASQGKGLGLEFLRHIERVAVIVHVVDCATFETQRDPVSDIELIESELSAYADFSDRPRMVVLNKIDVPDAAELAEFVRADLEQFGWPVFAVSAVAHQGLSEFVYAAAALVREARRQRAIDEVERPRVLVQPIPVNETDFEVKVLANGAFRITGTKPTRWVRQTDFGNDDAVAFLAERLARLGVEDRLKELGAQPGCDVYIGPVDNAVVFDWQPTFLDDEPEVAEDRDGMQRFFGGEK